MLSASPTALSLSPTRQTVRRGEPHAPKPPLTTRRAEVELQEDLATVRLEPGQQFEAEPGAVLCQDPGLETETRTAGGGSPEAAHRKAGFWKTVVQGGKRLLSGENLFINRFTARHRAGAVTLAAPYPSRMVLVDLAKTGGLVCQRGAYLGGDPGVHLALEAAPAGVGFLGREGFFFQRLSGPGRVLLQVSGTVVKKTLKPGETLEVDDACLAAWQPSVKVGVGESRGWKSGLLRGESFFMLTVTGPGTVYLQSQPLQRMARRFRDAAPERTGDGTQTLNLVSQLLGNNG